MKLKPHCLWIALLASIACAKAADYLLDETFGADSEKAWVREPDSSSAALAFGLGATPGGLRFDPAPGFGSIWRKVDAGTDPCEVSCEVELTRGTEEAWRWPGLVVALASAEPSAMKDDDWALVLSVHKQGLRLTAVRKGILQPRLVREGIWHFSEQEIPKRYEVTQGGAGGHHFSLQWPEKNLARQRVRLWAARTAAGQLRFAASHLYGPGATWWEAECALPAQLTAKPLSFLAVRTVREARAPDKWTEPLDAARGYGSTLPAGVLRWVRIRSLKPEETPTPPVFQETDLPQAWMLQPAPGETHPALYGDARQLAEARQRLNEPRWQAWREMLLKQARKDNKLHDANRIGVQLSSCVWAWTLTGESAARDAALELIDRLTTATDSLPQRQHNWPGRRRQTLELDEFACHAIEGLATAYDLMHAELGEARRRAVLRVLHRGLDYYRTRMRDNDWWYANNPSNTIGVGAGCHGLGALALRAQRPEDAEEVIKRAVQAIQERYIGIADDGGCLEGTLYWQYGGMYPIVFGFALERATGDSRDLLDLPRFRNAGAYARVILGGDGEMTCFNDTQPWLNGLVPLALCGGRHNDPLSLWLVDRMAALLASDTKQPLVGDQRLAGPALLLRGEAAAPAVFPGVPTLAKLDSIAEGVLRSDGGELPKLLVAVKGNGRHNTHHANADQGSITLAARGETLLIDPGYYEADLDCHSLPVPADADLKAWSTRAAAPLSDAWEHGSLRTLTVDASLAAQKLGLARQRRVVALLDDRAVVLLDELAPENGPRRMRLQFQCGFPVEVLADRRSARIKGAKGDLLISVDAPGLQLADAPPRKFAKEGCISTRAVHGIHSKANGPVKRARRASPCSSRCPATATAPLCASNASKGASGCNLGKRSFNSPTGRTARGACRSRLPQHLERMRKP